MIRNGPPCDKNYACVIFIVVSLAAVFLVTYNGCVVDWVNC